MPNENSAIIPTDEKKDEKTNQNKYALMVKVLPNGNLSIKAKDAVEIWHDFTGDFWATRIATLGLVGNRQSLNQKFGLYQAFLGQEERTQSTFVLLARRLGYRADTIEELWNDFIYIFQPDFKEWLKEKMMPRTQADKDNEELIF